MAGTSMEYHPGVFNWNHGIMFGILSSEDTHHWNYPKIMTGNHSNINGQSLGFG
jgi:hypothetical protein